MNSYISSDQQSYINQYKKTFIWRTQWPTWLVIIIIYSGWFFTLLFWKKLGLMLSGAILVVLSAWYMSLQHELLHGFPTRWNLVNKLLGLTPFAIWLPFDLYKERHLAHHTDELLTTPAVDPETNYVTQIKWENASTYQKNIFKSRRNILSRIIFGPIFSIYSLLVNMIKPPLEGDFRYLPMWALHIFLVTILLYFVHAYFNFPIWAYLIVSYLSLSLASVRSFYEHRPAQNFKHRTVINEAGLFFRLLFLNNNYHIVHHELPILPWFMVRKVFYNHRNEYLNCNGYFHLKGYLSLFKKYSLSTIDTPNHVESLKGVQIQIDQVMDEKKHG